MSGSGLSAALGLAIFAVLALRAGWILRSEQNAGRGSEPGPGHHVLRSEYFSGGGGGGQSREYTVPRDPQDYARLFVPKRPTRQDRTQ